MGASHAVEESIKATNAVFADVVKHLGGALGVMGLHDALGKLAIAPLGLAAVVSLGLFDLRYRESLHALELRGDARVPLRRAPVRGKGLEKGSLRREPRVYRIVVCLVLCLRLGRVDPLTVELTYNRGKHALDGREISACHAR